MESWWRWSSKKMQLGWLRKFGNCFKTFPISDKQVGGSKDSNGTP